MTTDQAERLRQIVGTKAEEEPKEELRALPVGSARVIAITSGKGGVGKTNLTVNLALALQEAGARVLVIDADLGMANVDVVLGTKSKGHLLNLLEESVTLGDVLQKGPKGLRYISGGSGIEKAADFTREERELLLGKLAACADFADVILIDTGAGLGKNVMDFILAADEVLLLTTPEPTALTDAYAVMKAYSMYAKEKNIRLVVNRVYDEAESKEVVKKLQQTSERFLGMTIDCLGYIFEDSAVMRSVRAQTPFLVAYPSCIASRCIHGLANAVLYGSRMTVTGGWRGFLRQIFKFTR